MKQFLTLIRDIATQFWEERQARERQYLIAAALVFIALLIYLIGIDPAIEGRQQLLKSLPTLHEQAAQMQQMAQELGSLPSPENLFEVSRDSIESSLAKNNLKAQSLSVVDGVVRAQISPISIAALQTWLLELQRSSALFVDEMKITALEEGMVNATFTLRQSNRDG